MKIKVVVLDDDYSALTAIKNYCEQLDLSVIGAFDSPQQFINKIDELKFDLAILDYQMPQFNGLQVAEILSSKGVPIVFITGHRKEIAEKAWDLNCIACIEKPINIEKVSSAVQKLNGFSTKVSKLLSVAVYGGEIARIKTSDIAYITSCKEDTSGNDKSLITLTRIKYRIVKKKLEELMDLLPASDFIIIGKSHIVSREAIKTYSMNYETIKLKIKDESGFIELNVSPTKKDAFKKWIHL